MAAQKRREKCPEAENNRNREPLIGIRHDFLHQRLLQFNVDIKFSLQLFKCIFVYYLLSLNWMQNKKTTGNFDWKVNANRIELTFFSSSMFRELSWPLLRASRIRIRHFYPMGDNNDKNKLHISKMLGWRIFIEHIPHASCDAIYHHQICVPSKQNACA